MKARLVLGVDIGGSHIGAALVDLDQHAILSPTLYRTTVDSSGDVGEIINSWAAVITQSWSLGNVSSSVIGIAMPGPFDYETGISFINNQGKYQALYGFNIKILLAEKLAISPTDIRFINDASSFLKGEMIAGSLKGVENGIGITLGTGLGSAYQIAGQLVDAEFWQMPFKSGIAEDYLSARWFVNEYSIRYNKITKGLRELLETSVGREEAIVLFESFAVNLADFIKLLNVKLNCPDVVIGGNITRAASFFWNRTCSFLKKNSCSVNVSIAELGEIASIIGAATLFEQEMKNSNFFS